MSYPLINTEKPLNDPYMVVLKQLLSELLELQQKIEVNANNRLLKYKKNYKSGHYSESAYNLAHYLEMRQFDLRQLQDRLAQAGLSSLGRAEASVVATFNSVIDVLHYATDKDYHCVQTIPTIPNASDFSRGKELLQLHTNKLFGALQESRKAHVMVTLGTDVSWNYNLVSALLNKGMTCARINCAHDDTKVWEKMIENVRRAISETGMPCPILMDLAGHKIRTGPVALEPPIYHIKVKKDRSGKVVASGYLILTVDPQNTSIETDLFKIQIPKDLHKKLTTGLLLGFIDQQDKPRYLKIEKALSSTDWLVSCDKSAYLISGCKLSLLTPESLTNKRKDDISFSIGKFDGAPLDIRIIKGELLLLTPEHIEGRPAEYSASGVLVRPAHIGCTLSLAIDKLEVGQPVWLDDGKLGAVVEKITDQGALLRVTVAKPNGVKIQSDKGINFPETDLGLPPLSEKDLKDLDFVCTHADMVGFSFVETLDDMKRLMKELAKRKASSLPIIAKIETNRAVKNLPDILLGTMGRHRLGVMIARGDLAVELGGARLAEVQEELLWLCEAAHVPVIWATQVLESIAKKGIRSRPEFTDAAMAVRAECVMLNKGPYILDAIEALVNVMIRMDEHQRKKFSRLRALHW